MGLQEAGGVVAPDEVGVVEDLVEQVGVGGRSLNDQLLQARRIRRMASRRVGGVDDDLGDQRVVVGGDGVAL